MGTRMIVLAGCGVCAMVLAAFIGICLFDCYSVPTARARVALHTLDLSCDSISDSEIERAYRRKAKLYHPDVRKTANLESFLELENATRIVKQLRQLRCFPRKINVVLIVGVVLCASVALVVFLVSDQTATESSRKIPVVPLADETVIIHQPPVMDDQPEAEKQNLMRHTGVVENPSVTATQPASHPVRAFIPVPHVVGNDNGNSAGSGVLGRVLTAVARPNEVDLSHNDSHSNVVIPAIGKEKVQTARSTRTQVTFKDRADEADKENNSSSPEIVFCGYPEVKQKKKGQQKTTARRSPVPVRQQPMRAAKEGKVKSAALSQSGRRGNQL